jgi:hypothetical protein
MSGAWAAGSPAGSAHVKYVGHLSTDSNQPQYSVLCFLRFLFSLSFVTDRGGKGKKCTPLRAPLTALTLK